LASEYAIDDTAKTITVPAGVSTEELLENMRIVGGSGMTLAVENNQLRIFDNDEIVAEYAIKNMTLSQNGTTVTAAFSAQNNTDAPRTLLCIVAAYDQRGRLIQFSSDQIYLDAGASESAAVTIDGFNPAYTYRSFIWDAETYVPMCPAETL
jgi:hypothetical protein